MVEFSRRISYFVHSAPKTKSGWTMPRGRPQASWLRQVESYLSHMGMADPVCLGDGQTKAYLKDMGMTGLASVWVMARRRTKEYRRKVNAVPTPDHRCYVPVFNNCWLPHVFESSMTSVADCYWYNLSLIERCRQCRRALRWGASEQTPIRKIQYICLCSFGPWTLI